MTSSFWHDTGIILGKDNGGINMMLFMISIVVSIAIMIIMADNSVNKNTGSSGAAPAV